MSNGNGNGKEKLIEKIRKLMALSSSPNENEAALAAEKAQALLAEHNLSISDVTAGVTEEDFRIEEMLDDASVPWRRPLAQAVAEMYFCNYFFSFVKVPTAARANGYIRYDKHCFVGARHNLIVATEMFKYLERTIRRLAEEHGSRQPKQTQSSYKTSFRNSCSMRLCSRIRERIAEAKRGNVIKTESGTNLPALADMYERTNKQLSAFINEKVGRLRHTKSRASSSNAAGVMDGRAAGDRIGLDAQVGGRSGHLLGKR